MDPAYTTPTKPYRDPNGPPLADNTQGGRKPRPTAQTFGLSTESMANAIANLTGSTCSHRSSKKWGAVGRMPVDGVVCEEQLEDSPRCPTALCACLDTEL